MLNLNLVNGYIYISNTNALKLYNYTIKNRLMFYFIMISLFKSSSHEKKKKIPIHQTVEGASFHLVSRHPKYSKRKSVVVQSYQLCLPLQLQNTFISSVSTIGLIFVWQHKRTNFNVLKNTCVLSFEFFLQ